MEGNATILPRVGLFRVGLLILRACLYAGCGLAVVFILALIFAGPASAGENPASPTVTGSQDHAASQAPAAGTTVSDAVSSATSGPAAGAASTSTSGHGGVVSNAMNSVPGVTQTAAGSPSHPQPAGSGPGQWGSPQSAPAQPAGQTQSVPTQSSAQAPASTSSAAPAQTAPAQPVSSAVTSAATQPGTSGTHHELLMDELAAGTGLCALLVLWCMQRVRRLSPGRQAHRALASGMWLRGIHEYKLMVEGVAWRSPDGSAVFVPWSVLTGIRETRRLFLLLDQGGHHVRGFIPKAALSNLPKDTELGQLIRERIAAAATG